MKIKYYNLVFLVLLVILVITVSYIWDSNFQYNGIYEKNHFIEKEEEINFPYYEEENFISQYIYRIWFVPEKKDDKAELQKYKGIFQRTKDSCKDFKQEILLGKEKIEKFVLKYYNIEVLNIIKLINHNYPACVSDIIRLLVIYAKGGVYLDIKSEITKDISYELNKYKGKLLVFNWINFPFFGNFWTKSSIYGEMCNWGFACNKGNPVLREILNSVLLNIKDSYKEKEKYNKGYPYILSLTGPHIFTHKILNTKNKDKVKILGANFNGKFKYSSSALRRTSFFNKDKTHWKKIKENIFV